MLKWKYPHDLIQFEEYEDCNMTFVKKEVDNDSQIFEVYFIYILS